MPSEFQLILMSLQGDLNNIMLSSLAANHALSNILGLYSDDTEYSLDKNKMYISRWTIAMDSLTNALEAFNRDSNKLEEYLNDKG